MPDSEPSHIRQLAARAREHRMRQAVDELHARLRAFQTTVAAIEAAQGSGASGASKDGSEEPAVTAAFASDASVHLRVQAQESRHLARPDVDLRQDRLLATANDAQECLPTDHVVS